MGRAICHYTFADAAGNRIPGASVNVYEAGTTNAISATIQDSYSGGSTLTNPLTTDVNGAIVFYLAKPQRVDLKMTKSGYADLTVSNVPVEEDPGVSYDALRILAGPQNVDEAGTWDFGTVVASHGYLVTVLATNVGQDKAVVALVHTESETNARVHNLYAAAGMAISAASFTQLRFTNTTGQSQTCLASILQIY